MNNLQLRKFDDAAINRAIDKALESVPSDRTGVVIAHADLEGASLSVVAKFGDQWSLVAKGFKKWDGELGAQAEVRFMW